MTIVIRSTLMKNSNGNVDIVGWLLALLSSFFSECICRQSSNVYRWLVCHTFIYFRCNAFVWRDKRKMIEYFQWRIQLKPKNRQTVQNICQNKYRKNESIVFVSFFSRWIERRVNNNCILPFNWNPWRKHEKCLPLDKLYDTIEFRHKKHLTSDFWMTKKTSSRHFSLAFIDLSQFWQNNETQ